MIELTKQEYDLLRASELKLHDLLAHKSSIVEYVRITVTDCLPHGIHRQVFDNRSIPAEIEEACKKSLILLQTERAKSDLYKQKLKELRDSTESATNSFSYKDYTLILLVIGNIAQYFI